MDNYSFAYHEYENVTDPARLWGLVKLFTVRSFKLGRDINNLRMMNAELKDDLDKMGEDAFSCYNNLREIIVGRANEVTCLRSKHWIQVLKQKEKLINGFDMHSSLGVHNSLHKLIPAEYAVKCDFKEEDSASVVRTSHDSFLHLLLTFTIEQCKISFLTQRSTKIDMVPSDFLEVLVDSGAGTSADEDVVMSNSEEENATFTVSFGLNYGDAGALHVIAIMSTLFWKGGANKKEEESDKEEEESDKEDDVSFSEGANSQLSKVQLLLKFNFSSLKDHSNPQITIQFVCSILKILTNPLDGMLQCARGSVQLLRAAPKEKETLLFRKGNMHALQDHLTLER